MRLNQIEQIITVATAGSISRAAAELFISQPNLSASIRDVEKELGQKIFERSGKGIRLTAFGSEFLAYAKPVLHSYGNLTDFCKEVEAPKIRRLHVATQQLRFASILFDRFCSECASDPCDFSFLEGSETEVAGWVHNQQADLGLVAQTPEQRKMNQASYARKGLIYTQLCRQKLSVVLRKDHPLLKKESPVTSHQLWNFPLALYQDTNYGSTEMVSFVWNGSGRQKIVVNSRAALYELLSSTDAFTLAAHSRSAYQKSPYYTDILTVPLADSEYEIELGCLVSSSRPLSESAEAYLNSIRQAIKES